MISVLLTMLVVGHFFADFALQTEYMALGKNKWTSLPNTPWYWPMIAHCSIHLFFVFLAVSIFLLTLSFPVTLCCCVGLLFGLTEFVFHFIIDSIKCKKMINYDMDQLLHISCKLFYIIIVLLII